MSPLHPHWHETEHDEHEVPVHGAHPAKETQTADGIPISRKPAAILGMLIVSSLACAYYYSAASVTEQSTPITPNLIYITDNGMEPDTLSVAQGTTITWINQQSIPQILESTELCNESNACLYTPTIFPGEQVEFTITADIAPGTYMYDSVTAAGIQGTIIVLGEGTAVPVEEPETSEPASPAELEEHSGEPALPPPPNIPEETSLSIEEEENEPMALALEEDPLPSAPEIPQPTPTPAPTTNTTIPTNPNVAAQVQAHAGAPAINTTYKPLQQPTTGASSWIVFVGSIAALTFITRRAFAW